MADGEGIEYVPLTEDVDLQHVDYPKINNHNICSDEDDDPSDTYSDMGDALARSSVFGLMQNATPHDDAAIYLHEGAMNFWLREHPRNEKQRRLWYLLHKSWYAWLDLFLALVYLSLALIEEPAVWKVPIVIPGIVQAICLSFNGLDFYLRYRRHGSHWQFQGAWLSASVLLLLTVDLVLYFVTENEQWHVLRALRPFYLIKTDFAAPVRRVVRGILQTLMQVMDIIVFYFFYIGVFAVIGVFLFSDDKDNWFFATLGEAYTQLFVLMTTCNYPNVMMPAYAKTKWNFLYFFVFISVGLYFITNLLLAIIYQKFTAHEQRTYRKLLIRRRHALRLAFASMVGSIDDTMSRNKYEALLRRYNPSISKKKAALCFYTLNSSGTGALTLDEFYTFYDALELSWRLPDSDGPGSMHQLWWFKRSDVSDRLVYRLQRIALSKALEMFINFIVFGQAVFLFVFVAKYGDSRKDTLRLVMGCFLAVYVVEAALKISALTFKIYWRNKWNRFDLALTLVGLLGVIIESKVSLRQVPLALRSLRLIRVMALRKSFQHLIVTAGTLVPRMGRFAGALFCFYYTFAIVGMALFNRTVSECPSDTPFCGGSYMWNGPPHASAENGFGHYQLNNFNSITEAYVTLFELMVVNDWNNTLQGHVAMTNNFARIFFFFYFVFQVLVVMNVVVAFVLEAFQVVVVGSNAAEQGDNSETKPDDQLLLENIVEISADEARTVLADNDKGLRRLNDTNSFESQQGFLCYRGWRGVTQLSLFRIIYKDAIESWIAEDEAGLTKDRDNVADNAMAMMAMRNLPIPVQPDERRQSLLSVLSDVA